MKLQEQINRIHEMMGVEPTPYAVIEITKPLARMPLEYYYQAVPYWYTKEDRIYIKRGSAGGKSISTKNIKVLKVFEDGETEELYDFLEKLRSQK
jgi:hypothetical protein